MVSFCYPYGLLNGLTSGGLLRANLLLCDHNMETLGCHNQLFI
jgi:hypothetical protein